MLNPLVALPPDPPFPATLFCPDAEALPGLPPFPAATPTNAILVFPEGTVYVPDELNVCNKAYAGATGVTLPLAELVAVSPVEDVAFTVNVYAVPFVNPVTVIGDVPLAVIFPGLEIAV
jgi:hypothetical protein